jgi:hypothetical protein
LPDVPIFPINGGSGRKQCHLHRREKPEGLAKKQKAAGAKQRQRSFRSRETQITSLPATASPKKEREERLG